MAYEYAIPAVASSALVVLAERRWLRTGLFRSPSYWSTMAICLFFMVLVNGWLTKLSAPIVKYDPAQKTRWRVPVGHPGGGLLLRVHPDHGRVAGLGPPGHCRRPRPVVARTGWTVIVGVALVVVAFVVMEPFTYLAHRFVMHGVGRRLHRSHHRRWPARHDGEPFLEANDSFPVVFAAVTMVALAVGFNVTSLRMLVPICVGVTVYGAAYAYVHDGYIHRRVRVRRSSPRLERLAEAHALHHRFGGEPYGMLFPVVPASLRARGRAAVERVDATPRP